MSSYQPSELALSPDGRPYHIHVAGDELADNVILVGDPSRVAMFRPLFEEISYESNNREINLITGVAGGVPITVLSTGMGCDNIDIVMTELDAAANIVTSPGVTEKNAVHRRLNIIRLGTCGSLNPKADAGAVVASHYAIGLDGLMNYYQCNEYLFETGIAESFAGHIGMPKTWAKPYCVRCDEDLFDIFAQQAYRGITVTAPGFYGPQGRHIRLAPAIPDFIERAASFEWLNIPVTNLEMETSAIYAFARQLGHRALTLCLVIANRTTGKFINDYHAQMQELIDFTVKRFSFKP
ncbi:MAG: nucleoside phosphorylase [Bacteroidales bacterium]|nr:nucleoside phosphorylase [Bacteroidales bacterium]